jgi:TldD protein
MGILEGFDPDKVIRAALANGGEFADLFFEDSRSAAITAEEGHIKSVVAGRDRGCGIRVISNAKTYYAYTSDITEKGLVDLASIVAGGVREGVEFADLGPVSKSVAKGFDILKPPATVPLEQKIELVTRADKCAWGYDKRVKQVRVSYGDGFRRVGIFNSLGEWTEEERSGIVFICSVVTAEGEVMQTGYEPLGGIVGLEIFDTTSPEEVAEIAAKRAVTMLGARRAPGGTMPVILSSEAGGTMIHEAVGHGLEADLALNNLSVYGGKIGERVATDVVSVVDDGTIANKRGSSFFDDEATPTKRNVLIENGILKSYMYDRLSAMKWDAKSTGNGRRQSYQHRPIVRMTNTLILPGESKPEEIVKSIDSGLFVKKMGGGQVNTVNGDFVFEVTEGYVVENGVVGEMVRGATLTGNGPEVLMKIDMVGTDLGYGIGTCGKDGQGVPVSDAQPTLRIPEIVVGGDVSN